MHFHVIYDKINIKLKRGSDIMRIALVDDDKSDLSRLHAYINEYSKNFSLSVFIKSFTNGEEFLHTFSSESFDLIFLDIFMGNINGMDIAEEIRKTDKDCLIIFSTSSSDYAIQGYQVKASNYLVKPYSYDKLVNALQLCRSQLLKKNNFITIKEGRYFIKILLQDIIYTDYRNHYIQIHTDKRIIRCHMSFDEFSPILSTYKQFLCCYRNCLINMDQVAAIEGSDFVLYNKERIPIKRNEKKAIVQCYADYIFHQLHGGTYT